MISANNLRPGVVFLMDDELYTVVEYSYVKPGKGIAYAKTKLRR
ncbi:elongation factor P, partial [Candidatus Poribacteria bacterium]|nr:elongation factor P [Candidatus Poribacteria bacterium]